MTNKNKDWREEFDMNFLRVGTQILLGIDHKEIGESMAIQIKKFIEQVEANAKREAYEEVMNWLEYGYKQSNWSPSIPALIMSLKERYLTKNKHGN